MNYSISKPICFYLILFSLVFLFKPSYSFSGEWCGTTPENEIKMYENVVEVYKEAQKGLPSRSFGLMIDDHGAGFEAPRCWSLENQVKLANLLREMISDERLHDETIANAIMHYIRVDVYDKQFAIDTMQDMLKNDHSHDVRMSLLSSYLHVQILDDFVLNILESADEETKQLISRIVNRYYYKLDSLSEEFLKKSLKQIDEEKLKYNVLKALAKKESFDKFIGFCKHNNIEIPDEIIRIFNSFEAIDYLLYKYERESIDYQNPDNNNEYFRFSNYILYILANNLHRSFPNNYLERMTSQDLRYLRNGIYATYGKTFKSKVLQYYFYGSYPNVKKYCRNSKCGNRDIRKRTFKRSDLTEIDKVNIANIISIEKNRKENGYKEDILVENYDLTAFLNGTADNYTLSSPKLRNIYQVKLDWARQQIWIWDKKGISHWDLKSAKRLEYFKKAKGPIDIAVEKGLVAYKEDNKIIVRDIIKNITTTTINLSFNQDVLSRRPEVALYYFSPDGRYFMYSDHNPTTRNDTITVIDIESGEKRFVIDEKFYFYFYDVSAIGMRTGSPLVFSNNNENIIAKVCTINKPYLYRTSCNKPGILVIDLKGNSWRLLDFDYYSLAITLNDDKLYIDRGKKIPIRVYKLDEILEMYKIMPLNVEHVDVGSADFRTINKIEVAGKYIFRSDYSYVGLLPISYGENNNTKRIAISSVFDISKDKIVYAIGYKTGYVVIRKVPD